MLRGEKCVGPFIWMGGPSVAEAMTFTNADFMVLDTEHGVFDIESVQSMIRAAQKGNVTCEYCAPHEPLVPQQTSPASHFS